MKNKAYWNFVLDNVIFLAMLFVIFSGVVLWGWLRPAPANPGNSANPAKSAVQTSNVPAAQIASASSTDHRSKDEQTLSHPGHGQGLGSGQGVGAHGVNGMGPNVGKSRIFWGLIENNTFWGMTKNGGWKSLHCWIGMAVLLPLMILHLLMHWGWITTMFSRHCCCRGGKKSDSDGQTASLEKNDAPQRKE